MPSRSLLLSGSHSSISINSRDIKKIAGLWQQTSSENLWQYYRTLGMGMASSYIVTWHYPILQYSFPDEESFKVDIVHETGFWFWPGQKVTQIFELNGVNVHQNRRIPRLYLALDGHDTMNVTTRTEHISNSDGESIISETTGRPCGKIITTRNVNDIGELVWVGEIIDADVKCVRIFKKII